MQIDSRSLILNYQIIFICNCYLKTYCPGGGSAASTVAEASATGGGAEASVDDAADADVESGISTDFQSSSGSTVRAIKVPTFTSFVPSGT